MERKTIERAVSIAAATLIAAGLALGATLASAADKIRMGSRNTNLDLVLLESGIADKYDLDIEVVRVKTGIEMVEALIGGSIDIGIVGGAPMTSALLKTDRLVVVGNAWTTDGGYAKILVRKDSPLKSIMDLKGKKIANKIGSGSYRALGDWCAKNGCKITDFEILNTAPAAIIAALESGSVDAGIWFAPTTSIAVHKGVARILGDFKGANLGQATWAARKAFAGENVDVMNRFMAATVDAQELIVNDPDKASELLAQGLKKIGQDLPIEVLKLGINDFVYEHGLNDKKVEVFDAIFVALKAQGKYRGDKPDFRVFFDPSYYEAGLKLRK
jgi:sulfonate transport system substrate-binding protein